MPRLSQEALAEIVGTTRGRVNFFMNKFRKRGLIDYNGGIKVKPALYARQAAWLAHGVQIRTRRQCAGDEPDPW